MGTGRFFTELFGRSPVEPIQKHIGICHDCATQLQPFLKAVYANDWELAGKVQSDIVKLEHEADDLQMSIRLHLPKSLFMPVPRTDLLDLLGTQDKIANRAKDIAGIMLGRQMAIPKPLQKPVMDYLKRSLAASEQAMKVINELDELIETGFGGREIKLIEKMITKLNSIESETDQIEIKIRGELFKIEMELAPVDVMFLYKVIEWIGDLADLAQHVGQRLQLLLAR
ncbi:MAG: TIGR00153 family protein [Pseudomonadales bacterium]